MTTVKLPPDLLTVPQAAERLGISASTLQRMVLRGELPEAIKIGRQWRVSRPRLERRLHGDEAQIAPGGSVHGTPAGPEAAPLASGPTGATS